MVPVVPALVEPAVPVLPSVPTPVLLPVPLVVLVLVPEVVLVLVPEVVPLPDEDPEPSVPPPVAGPALEKQAPSVRVDRATAVRKMVDLRIGREGTMWREPSIHSPSPIRTQRTRADGSAPREGAGMGVTSRGPAFPRRWGSKTTRPLVGARQVQREGDFGRPGHNVMRWDALGCARGAVLSSVGIKTRPSLPSPRATWANSPQSAGAVTPNRATRGLSSRPTSPATGPWCPGAGKFHSEPRA